MRPVLRLLFGGIGVWDWMRFAVLNRLACEGREHLAGLPPTDVLLVSNHLTYYMDVLAIHHALTSEKRSPFDGFRANLDVGFVAAFETLQRSRLGAAAIQLHRRGSDAPHVARRRPRK